MEGFYDVVFIDYGNCCKIAVTDIHPLKPEYVTLPAQALPCTLSGVSHMFD
jgi:hypothetical protein